MMIHPSNLRRHLRGLIDEDRARRVMALALKMMLGVGDDEAVSILPKAAGETVAHKNKRRLALHLSHTLGKCALASLSAVTNLDRATIRQHLAVIEERRDGGDAAFDREIEALEAQFQAFYGLSSLAPEPYLDDVIEGIRDAA